MREKVSPPRYDARRVRRRLAKDSGAAGGEEDTAGAAFVDPPPQALALAQGGSPKVDPGPTLASPRSLPGGVTTDRCDWRSRLPGPSSPA